MQNNKPKITVLMPVYNGGGYLKESIESILNQTFSDFEFLIIDDNSNDNTAQIVNSYKDKRIVYIKNEKNLGVSCSSNIGIRLSRGEYIARTDCDDISFPGRLERQIKYLERNKNISVCGTWAQSFGLKNEIMRAPVKNEEIQCQLLFNSAFIHSSVIIRKDIFVQNGFYYPTESNLAEDYYLWAKIFQKTVMANIPKVLVKYRLHHNSASYSHHLALQESANKIRFNMLNQWGEEISNEEFEIHQMISRGEYIDSYDFVYRSQRWFLRMLDMNLTKKVYNQSFLEKYLSLSFYFICSNAKSLGWGRNLKIFFKSPLSGFVMNALIDKSRYIMFNFLTP